MTSAIPALEKAAAEAMEKYGDIIDLPHHRSQIHPPLSRTSRAAQFSPFAALRGYGDSITEASRLTDVKPELSDEQKEELDRVISFIRAGRLKTPVRITYFRHDETKEGGQTITIEDTVIKVTEYPGVLYTAGISIPVEDILQIESFTDMNFEQEEGD